MLFRPSFPTPPEKSVDLHKNPQSSNNDIKPTPSSVPLAEFRRSSSVFPRRRGCVYATRKRGVGKKKRTEGNEELSSYTVSDTRESWRVFGRGACYTLFNRIGEVVKSAGTLLTKQRKKMLHRGRETHRGKEVWGMTKRAKRNEWTRRKAENNTEIRARNARIQGESGV